MKIPLKSLLIGMFVLLGTSLYSQSPKFYSYTSIPGQRKLDVQVISQDNLGYMWFGTKNGLIKYDGSIFTTYTTADGLVNNTISAVMVDSSSTIWVGHPSGKISYGQKDGFHAFEPEEGLPVVEISSFFIDNKKDLWFSTMGEGVYTYTGKHRKRLYNLSVDEGLADNYVYQMIQDSNGYFYIATDKGVSVYDTVKHSFINTLSMSDGLPDNIVTHLLLDGDNLWIGMYEGGICKYNLSTKALSLYGDWPFSSIQDFVLSEAGDLMVSTQKHGLIKCEIKQDKFFYNRLGTANNLASNRTSTIICDRERNLWVGTNKGISIQKNQGIEFLDQSTGFDVQNIYGVTFDKKGNYWIASQQGLYRAYPGFDGKIITDQIEITNNRDGSAMSFISIYCDVDGFIWAGTYGYGVFCIDTEDNMIRNYSQEDGFLNENIIHINGDGETIWLSTLGGGVVKLAKGKDHSVETFSTQNGLSSDYVYSTFIDEEGKVWCATDGGGVSIIDNGKAHIYDSAYFAKNLRAVYSIAKDIHGNMWFNSPDFGVLKKENDTYIPLTDSATFINGSIVGLVSSAYEMVTISDEVIEKHLYYYDQTLKLNEDDFLANQNPNLNAVYVDSSSNIWIGTAKGIIKLNHIEPNENIKPLLSINQVSLFFKPLEQFKQRFKYNQNHITFDFNALWYKDNEKLTYRYKLHGFDLDWTETSVMKRVTYSNLPADDFEFIVQVNYPGGSWVETDKSSFQFRIIPPFWRQLWFIISFIIVLVSLIIWVIRFRTQRLARDKKLLESEVRRRTAEIQKQKEEIEDQRDEITKQHTQVVEQRDRIESQNKSITASIQYASRIQNALLPPMELFDKYLTDYFIFFKPRDIVSGDFYFALPYKNSFVIAAADCTGHGVPGAFMSVLSISLLKQILGQDNCIYSAAEILNELRDMVKKALRQTGKADEAKDGLDISLCLLSPGKDILQYAGAYNPLMIVREGELIEHKANKMPIGIYQVDDKPFTNHEIKTIPGDMLYLYSDGYQDQFGGMKNRKFLPKRLRHLLLSIAGKPMEEQRLTLDSTFEDWRGNEPQVDDVLLIGIRC